MRISLPHSLSKAEVRQRLVTRLGDISGKELPGNIGQFTSNWEGDDALVLKVEAFGNSMAARIEIEENVVHVAIDLPLILSFAAGRIEDEVRAQGAKMLAAPKP